MSIRSEGRVPPAALMAELGKCFDREAKLLGLNNPDKVEKEEIKPIQIIRVREAPPRKDGPAQHDEDPEILQTCPDEPPSKNPSERQTPPAALLQQSPKPFKIVAKPIPPDRILPPS